MQGSLFPDLKQRTTIHGFEIRLLFLVKKQHQNQGTELVPWKSSAVSQEEDLKVPLRSTIYSISLFIGLTVFFSLFAFESILVYVGPVALLIYSFNLPIFVVFCVKKKKEEKEQIVQPPLSLQFHEEDIAEEDQQIEEENETISKKGG